MIFSRLSLLFIIIMSLFIVNCCSSRYVIYKENSYQPGHLPPLKPLHWLARELIIFVSIIHVG